MMRVINIVAPLIWSLLYIINRDGDGLAVQAFSCTTSSSREQCATTRRINNIHSQFSIRQQQQQQPAFTRRQFHIINKLSSSSLSMLNDEIFSDFSNDNLLVGIDDTTTMHSIFDNISNTVTTLVVATQTATEVTTEAWVQPTVLLLDPFLNFMSFAMLARVVLSWYPELKIKDAPWSAIVILPTSPLLALVKGVVPPAFGVDITPVFWLAIFTFIHEIFLGQQGLLTLKLKYGI